MNLPNGHLLQNGKYRLTHVIGQGGFGITYKGVWFTEVRGPLGTIKTEVPVCVKEYFFKDYCYRDSESFEVKVHSETGKALFDKFKEKLIKEAKILSDVHHPHIVNVLEVFEENNTAYIAMEYIQGCNLKHMMEKEGILPEKKVLRYVHQVGEALQFVHEKNILHLDIKPSNIIVDQTGDARLIDFGVSKRYDIEQQETSTTMLTLSKGFASIEQYDNEGTQSFSPCPDIYSLGATMYNLLTGKIPTESILRATRPLPLPSKLNPAISPKTEAAIIKAMAIVPAERFQSVSEMLAVLDYPEKEEEEPGKEMSSPEYEDGGETTVLFSSHTKTEGKDETVLNTDETSGVPKKRGGKVALVSLLIVLFASIGSVVAFLVQRDRSVTPPTEVSDTSLEEKNADTTAENNVPEIVVEEPEKKVETIEAKREPTVEDKPSVAQSHVEAEKSRKESVVKDVEKAVVMPQAPSKEETDAEFEALVAVGKEKMAAAQASGDAADFAKATKEITEASNAFSKAGKIKTTDELFDLIGECRVKQDEILFAGRKALYEEMKPFGNLMIVQRKDNQRYGAIDADANERIKCKYLAAYRTQQGYSAFLREDEMYDIYDTNGVMISERLSSYY